MSTYVCPHGCGKTWVGTTNRSAAQPLDADAVASANQASASNCSRLRMADGSSRALTMSSEDYPCRRVWMDSYLAAIDAKGPVVDPVPGGDVDDPVIPCDKANLAVQVTDFDGNPVENARVEVEGLGTSMTDAAGVVDFGQVSPGSYTAVGEKPDHRPEPEAEAGPATGSAQVSACESIVIPLKLDPMVVTKTHNIVFIGSEMYYDSFWWKMMFIGAA